MPLQSIFQPDALPKLKIVESGSVQITSIAMDPSDNIFPPDTPFTWSMTVELTGTLVPAVAAGTSLTFTAQLEPLVGMNPQIPLGSVTLTAPTSYTPLPPKATYVGKKLVTPTPGQIPPGAYTLTVALTNSTIFGPIDVMGVDQVLVQIAPGA